MTEHEKSSRVKIEYYVDGEVKDFVWVEFPEDHKATKEFFTYCKSKGISDSLAPPQRKEE